MKKFFINCLSSDGKISSKRMVTLLAFLMMAIGFLANLFWNFDISENIYTSMEYIVLGGLGFTASEQFSTRKTTPETTEEPK
jgi:hypothetical protein